MVRSGGHESGAIDSNFMPFSQPPARLFLVTGAAHVAVDSASGSIAQERLARLRQAIRNRQVSFPAQVPSFPRQYSVEIQWRAVTLYFVMGWTCEQLAARYRVTPSRVRQLLRSWVECAVALGYMQKIPEESVIARGSEKAAA